LAASTALVHVSLSLEALHATAATEIGTAVIAALAARGEALLLLTGGRTPLPIYRRLAEEPWRVRIDWPRVAVFFGDERAVPPDHAGSNYRGAQEALLARVPIAPANVHRIEGERGAAQAAERYEAVLRERLGGRPFDLALQGVGADGHVASLFPGSPALLESERLVVATEGPPPFTERITLTLPALCSSRHLVLVAAGAAKAAAVARALAPRAAPPVPAARVHPIQGSALWLIDASAAADIERAP
jgi:6-phosphogluconolactonase